MNLLLGLPHLTVLDVAETLESTTCTLELTGDPPACPDCGGVKRRKYGPLTSRVWDTPARGKPMRLIIQRPRYRCRCGATYVQPGATGIDDAYSSMTTRLVRYIHNAVLRRPLTAVATETGVSRTNVGLIAVTLANRLYEDHRFPTPEVLGIDDLRIRKKLFTVVTDGRTGKPVALVEGGSEKAINKELARRKIDPALVKIVVSDLGGSNIAVFKSMFKEHGAIHVADKWHVLKGVQEALSLVINKRVDHLRRRRAWCDKVLKRRARPPLRLWDTPAYLAACQERIDQLIGAKKLLMGARMKQAEDPQLSFTFVVDRGAIKTVLSRHAIVNKAFWVKMRLHMVYTRKSRADADDQIDRFIQRALSRSIAPQFKIIVNRVKTNRQLILNYFDALEMAGHVKGSAPTTGPTERRNGMIKTAWKAGRGLHDIKMFSMRALYEPWHLDVDIGVCSHAGCNQVDGPYSDRADRLRLAVAPGYRHHCQTHTPSP
jgi:transposase